MTDHGPWRVEWLPGSDLLAGRCACGAARTDTDPAALLDWFADHAPGEAA